MILGSKLRPSLASWLPWAVFVTILVATVTVEHYYGKLVVAKQQQDFASAAGSLVETITSRVSGYAVMLRGISGVIQDDPVKSLPALSYYMRRVAPQSLFPGTLGVGFAMHVRQDEVAEFERRMRQVVAQNFRLTPAGPRSEYFTIIFLHPLDIRNTVAIGYDMYSENVRREAMDRARLSHLAAISGKVTLVQEIFDEKQAGFLMFLPVFSEYSEGESPEPKLLGFAYAPLRADDLFRGIVDDGNYPPINFQVFDGEGTNPKNLLHDAARFMPPQPANFTPQFRLERPVEVGGRHWTLTFSSRPSFEAGLTDHLLPWILPIGFVVAAALSGAVAARGREHRSMIEQARVLAESERRFRSMADSAPVLIWMSGPGKEGVYFNKKWLEFTGRPIEEQIGSGWLSSVHPDDMTALRDCEAAFGERRPFTTQFRMRRHDGEYRYMLDSGVPRFREDRSFAGFIGSCTDITEVKVAEAEREKSLAAERKAREEVERLSRMKDEFLAGISHELRTPLNAVLGWSQLIRRKNLVSKEIEKGLDIIERNARIQAQIIEDLLDMNRIISGKLRLEVHRVELSDVIRKAIDTIRPAAEAKEIAIVAEVAPHIGTVRGDAGRLQQVFWNLLTNSVKFTPRQGTIKIGLAREGTNLSVSITDNGEGIDPRFLPHVFDRFRQGDASSSRTHGGLGLGLAIVKHLVELHGGSVLAFSEGKGKGATLKVVLPMSAGISDNGRLRDDALVPANLSLNGLSVLVVDDQEDARDLVKLLLEEKGAKVYHSDSAKNGLQSLIELRPDVLVSDISMPDEDGYQFMRKVRELPLEQGGRIPAIALTAYARNEDRAQALQSGFQMHLSKPIEANELCLAIAAVTGRFKRSAAPPSAA